MIIRERARAIAVDNLTGQAGTVVIVEINPGCVVVVIQLTGIAEFIVKIGHCNPSCPSASCKSSELVRIANTTASTVGDICCLAKLVEGFGGSETQRGLDLDLPAEPVVKVQRGRRHACGTFRN